MGQSGGSVEELPTDSGALVQPRIIKHRLYTKRCLYIVNVNNGGGDLSREGPLPGRLYLSSPDSQRGQIRDMLLSSRGGLHMGGRTCLRRLRPG